LSPGRLLFLVQVSVCGDGVIVSEDCWGAFAGRDWIRFRLIVEWCEGTGTFALYVALR
jgi:hypothetical protein